MSNERGFTGIWIPAELWDNKEYNISKKCFLAEIYALSKGPRGCIASNRHFSEFMGISKSRVSHILTEFTQGKLVNIQLTYKKGTKVIEQRKIIPTRKFHLLMAGVNEEKNNPKPIVKNSNTPIAKDSNPYSQDQLEGIAKNSTPLSLKIATPIAKNSKEDNTVENTIDNTVDNTHKGACEKNSHSLDISSPPPSENETATTSVVDSARAYTEFLQLYQTVFPDVKNGQILESIWMGIPDADILMIQDHLPRYLNSNQPRFLKNPKKYLQQKEYENPVIDRMGGNNRAFQTDAAKEDIKNFLKSLSDEKPRERAYTGS